ncbi:MAG TPA: hypothetical protein VGK74_13175 [Symbiobacteriaceae bacterium]
MPSRAFVPVPLTDAQPRVYKSFRGRQLKGILLGLSGAAISLWLFGMKDFTGYALAFLMGLPGFAYGYYQPQGKPVEYWGRVLLRYYTAPRLVTANREAVRPRWQIRAAQIGPIIRGVLRTLRPRKVSRKER